MALVEPLVLPGHRALVAPHRAPPKPQPSFKQCRWGFAGVAVGVASLATSRRHRCRTQSRVTSLEDTLVDVFQAYGDFLSGKKKQPWSLEEEDQSDESFSYCRFRLDELPPRQARSVGNTLRRTLLRQDLFRSTAPVAFRLQRRSYSVEEGKVYVSRSKAALHEYSSVPGVQESMLDVVKTVQHVAVGRAATPVPELPLAAVASNSTQPDSWRWISRRCGPCVIRTSDMDAIDSSTFYERPMCLPVDQHLLTVSSPVMVELELEVTECSQREWEISPAFEEYRQRLRFDRWLMVPPLFSPVKKVNYLVTGSDSSESLQLELPGFAKFWCFFFFF